MLSKLSGCCTLSGEVARRLRESSQKLNIFSSLSCFAQLMKAHFACVILDSLLGAFSIFFCFDDSTFHVYASCSFRILMYSVLHYIFLCLTEFYPQDTCLSYASVGASIGFGVGVFFGPKLFLPFPTNRHFSKLAPSSPHFSHMQSQVAAGALGCESEKLGSD